MGLQMGFLITKAAEERGARETGERWVLPEEMRQRVKGLLRSNETGGGITAAKEERNSSPTSRKPDLLGSAACRRRISDLEQETLRLPRGSVFVPEGTERVFQTCSSSGPCLLTVKSSL